MIVGNLIVELATKLRPLVPRHIAIPGIGVKVDEFNAPVPDVMMRPLDSLDGSFCDDMSVAFEVLSPGTARRDRKWKRQVYAALPALQHYVIISPKAVDVAMFSRADGFAERRITNPAADVELSAHGVALPLATLYRDTGLV